MKRTIRLFAILLLLASFLVIQTACANQLNGTYALLDDTELVEDSNDSSEELDGIFYTFTGNTVTVTVRMFGAVLNDDSATYRIKDDKIMFTSDKLSLYLASVLDMRTGKYTSTRDFEMGEDYIKIGGTVYIKQ